MKNRHRRRPSLSSSSCGDEDREGKEDPEEDSSLGRSQDIPLNLEEEEEEIVNLPVFHRRHTVAGSVGATLVTVDKARTKVKDESESVKSGDDSGTASSDNEGLKSPPIGISFSRAKSHPLSLSMNDLRSFEVATQMEEFEAIDTCRICDERVCAFMKLD